ncbi:MAG: UDP-N-acetylmuramoyl-L-alanine--D-glutamate ligase [Clostridiales bacterium]|nr:UDP-N-acetylmuramoyl-L-alanine--D-glutamate ligase [Clostridiales bacterium]
MLLSEYLGSLKGKSVSVIGIGVSNTPLIRLLLKAGISVCARDKRPKDRFGDEIFELEKMGATFILGPDYLTDLTEEVIFRTPGLNPNTPELKLASRNGSIITSEMEAFFEVCLCPIIAVTGSEGKTTTATLIAEILSEAGFTVHLGGNIGNPLLTETERIKPSDYSVLELSSFQLMTMTTSPYIAVCTNITPNHLDYHRDMAEYIAAKMNIFLHQKTNGLLVLNSDYPSTEAFTAMKKGTVRHFSRKKKPANGFFFDGNCIYLIENGNQTPVLNRSEIRLPGLYNIENIMAAFCAVYDIAGFEACRSAAKRFTGVEHRNELFCEKDGVKYINNTIASSPTRTIAELLSHDDKVIMIAGGYDKNIPYDALGPVICDKVKILVLTGETGTKIKASVEKACSPDNLPVIIEEPDFKKAVLKAAAMAKPGDIVTLSPASASFDRFHDFAERGNVYKEIIRSL